MNTQINNTYPFNLEISPDHLSIDQAQKALIMVHGRGGSAKDILTLGQYLDLKDFAVVAPEAANNSWYPQSFMADSDQNEPWLSAAIDTIDKTVQTLNQAGISLENIYFFGFSQGACLSLEYIARRAQRYGGAAAIIGGLIGKTIQLDNYKGDLQGTPVFIGTSNPDFHVPIERVYATVNILQDLGAEVTLKEYPGFGHSINQEELDLASQLIFARQH